MPKFENNGKSKAGRAQLRRAGNGKRAARNIGRMMLLENLLPDDELEKRRKKKRV